MYDKKIGDKIRELREAAGISQAELARRLGYANRSAISRIEGGYNGFPMDRLNDYASVLHCSVADILGLDADLNYGSELEAVQEIVANEIAAADAELVAVLISDYNKLNTAGKKEANKRVHEMSQLPAWTEGE